MGLDGKKDVHLDSSPIGAVSRIEVLEGPSGRRVRSEAERHGSPPRVCCLALKWRRWRASTGRWQIYDWRRRFRQRGELPSCEASQPPFAPLVDEGPLEERQVPSKLEIAIGDVVVRTDAAIDGEHLSRVIRAVRAS